MTNKDLPAEEAHWLLKEIAEQKAEIERLQKREAQFAAALYAVKEVVAKDSPQWLLADQLVRMMLSQPADEPVDAHKVQCKCGWVGMTNELVLLDGKYECPACSTEFKSLTAWPPLKSGAPQDCNCPYHPGAGRQHLQDCPGLLRDPNDCRTP